MQAEALLERIDRADRLLADRRGLVVVGAVYGGVLAVVFSVLPVSGVSRLALVLVAIVAVAAVLAVGRVTVRPLRDERARDERAMIEILDVLREVLPFVAERESWSNTRYQGARTRIARFPIAAERAPR